MDQLREYYSYWELAFPDADQAAFRASARSVYPQREANKDKRTSAEDVKNVRESFSKFYSEEDPIKLRYDNLTTSQQMQIRRAIAGLVDYQDHQTQINIFQLGFSISEPDALAVWLWENHVIPLKQKKTPGKEDMILGDEPKKITLPPFGEISNFGVGEF
ncbi:hypothetical protein AOL_s00091g49 [Orbilia oligospora ATCC 24927]|uniref:Uncharacterized protein n=1 Tax=Arthrobotrys oligospora (strain ATCC 24927 / CBS 115.81 / DSM 1491) TaxID=756982 RepID=G1XHZ7_ARTOA|nr:hypothetical protein AOL_s00091g49 [Orbilia oligospora ATCC 24927]EGX47228.1 hypothetical protein AOL_s00091g49 [Orbilia oligospora ATCC 24927]